MQQALSRFYGKLRPGWVALIFSFSGYGIQSNRQTYMVPVDAQIWAESDVKRDGFSLDSVLADMNTRGASVRVCTAIAAIHRAATRSNAVSAARPPD